MKILVIDAQGGGVGRRLVAALKKEMPEASVIAVGTNGAATSAMLKAGADFAATGENAVAVCCKDADIIAGPLGIVIADSMLGEVTPKIAISVARSRAVRVLIPLNRCDTVIAGAENTGVSALTDRAVRRIKKAAEGIS